MFCISNTVRSKISEGTATIAYNDKLIALGCSGISFDRIAAPTSQPHHAPESETGSSLSNWPYEVWHSSQYQETGIHCTKSVRQLLLSFVNQRLASRIKRFRVLNAVHQLNMQITPGVGDDKNTWECWQTDVRLMDEKDPAMKLLAWRDASVVALRKRFGIERRTKIDNKQLQTV